jgi:hypothetical protein
MPCSAGSAIMVSTGPESRLHRSLRKHDIAMSEQGSLSMIKHAIYTSTTMQHCCVGPDSVQQCAMQEGGPTAAHSTANRS